MTPTPEQNAKRETPKTEESWADVAAYWQLKFEAAELERARLETAYRTAWHALNAVAADGLPYAKRIINGLTRP